MNPKPHLTIAIIGHRQRLLMYQMLNAVNLPITPRSPRPEPLITKVRLQYDPIQIETERQIYTLYETADHQDAIKCLLGNAPILDGLVWCAPSDLPSAEDKELLELASKIGLSAVVIFLQPKPQDSEDDLDSAEFILRSTLQRCQLKGNDAAFIRDGTSLQDPVLALLEAMDTHLSPKTRGEEELLLPLEHPEFPPAEGSGVAFGRIERGSLRVGDQVALLSSLAIRRATVTAISSYPGPENPLTTAQAEDSLRCSLSGVIQRDVNRSHLIRGAERKNSPLVLTARCTALLYFLSPKKEDGLVVITETEAERIRNSRRNVYTENEKPRLVEGVTQTKFTFLRRQLQGKPVDLWSLTDETLPSATRLIGHAPSFIWKSNDSWAYEERQIDLIEAIPLEKGLVFLFGVESWCAGFGVVTSTERR